ncbi:MAG: NAD(P)H-hydrate dehydratase [Bacteroidales bacterium]|nr:NAD(P)H-hydrate dehydratase [Bacteroidales bacterium]
MKILTSNQIQKADSFTIQHEPIRSVDLMERAAIQLADWVVQRFDSGSSIIIFAGPGNNGGDGWALARLLYDKNFRNLQFYLLKISENISADSQINRDRLKKKTSIQVTEIKNPKDFPEIKKSDQIIDALFGTGLSRPLTGLAAELVQHINRSQKKQVIAIDIPGGLFGEDNAQNIRENIIKADVTLTFQFPKLSFLFPENGENTGEFFILPIGLSPEFVDQASTPYFYLTKEDISEKIKIRKKFSHKGTYGHGLLIAGCYGMMGAAVLASKASLRAGIGLVTSHIPRFGYEILQTAVPESLISIDSSDIIFTEFPELEKFNALAVGPGLGCKGNSRKALFELLNAYKRPMVIDADALNILGDNKQWIENIPEGSILTPHPKEFERLAGTFSDHYSRNVFQREFSKKHKLIVVLKGAHTAVTLPDGTCYFNTTGNPGMATAGSGDVLTGIILSLLAQEYKPEDAALIGVFVHGLAGDLAAEKTGQEAVIASDIIEHTGQSFIVLKERKW